MSSGPPTIPSTPLLAPEVVAAIAPTGVLRVGINMSNFLLVSGTIEGGEPVGVSPSLATSLAESLGLPLRLVPYPDPNDVVVAVASGDVDLGNIGADPTRAEQIAFTAPYCEIEATYLVRADSQIDAIGQVDRPGVRIASRRGAAYTLWLDRNITRATLIHTGTIDESFQVFVMEGLEVLAGLRPRLLDDAARLPGSRLLDGLFMTVEQAIGIRRDRGELAFSHLERFVGWAIQSGLVGQLIAEHEVKGLSVAAAG